MKKFLDCLLNNSDRVLLCLSWFAPLYCVGFYCSFDHGELVSENGILFLYIMICIIWSRHIAYEIKVDRLEKQDH